MQPDYRTLVFVPTYNEAENVAALYREIEGLGLGCDFLFLDDNSPDGTGKIIDGLAAANPRVFTIHRPGKRGIGSAHSEGIQWAYSRGYEVLITLDCDFTHSPHSIPDFIAYAGDHHMVIGSRFMSENSLPGWNAFRRTLTYGGHFMTNLLLRMPLDATGAFRLYRLDLIPVEIFKLITSRGYAFFFESLYVLWLNGAIVKEIPISLPARTQGNSKMQIRDAYQSFQLLLHLLRRRIVEPKTLHYSVFPPVTPRARATGSASGRAQ
ncbi:MAG: glycosyltransferase [Acidobacteriota bacterium]|nr:glycosyltransferase [Acidobacteriota bacterium]